MWASQVALVVKNPPANVGDVKDVGSIPGSGRSPEGGHSNPFQYSCLENPIDRGPWWATGHMVTKSQTRLKELNTRTHSHTHTYIWLLWELGDKESACQCRRCGFNLWSWKIPWTRKSQSTLVFLPGESHRQRSLACYSPWGGKESDTAQWLNNNNNIYSWELVLEK